MRNYCCKCDDTPSKSKCDDPLIEVPTVPDLPVPSKCTAVTIKIDTLTVHRHPTSGFFFDYEDWLVEFRANGLGPALPFDGLRIGETRPVNVEFPAELLSPSSTLEILVGGRHLVKPFGVVILENPLPAGQRTFGAAENYGMDTALVLSATDRERSYSVHYSIRCRTRSRAVASFVPMGRVAAFARGMASAFDGPKAEREALAKASDDALVHSFVQQAQTWGFRLLGIDAGYMLWEGPHDLPDLMERVQARSSGADKSAPRD